MGGFWRRLPLNEWEGFGQGSLEVKTPPLIEGGRFKTCPIASWSPAAEDVMDIGGGGGGGGGTRNRGGATYIYI